MLPINCVLPAKHVDDVLSNCLRILFIEESRDASAIIMLDGENVNKASFLPVK